MEFATSSSNTLDRTIASTKHPRNLLSPRKQDPEKVSFGLPRSQDAGFTPVPDKETGRHGDRIMAGLAFVNADPHS
jgi:hypothetical protein